MRSPEVPFTDEEVSPSSTETIYESSGLKQRLSRRLETWKLAFGFTAALGVIGVSQEAKANPEHDARAAEVAKNVRIENMDKLDKEATPERIRALLETLPIGFVERDMTSISFSAQHIKMPKEYGIKGHEAAHAAGGEGDEPGHANAGRVVYSEGIKETSDQFRWGETILHEVAHLNDWDTDANLSFDEKVDLAQDVVERVQSEDRYRSAYVEQVADTGDGVGLMNKATEYWAEITKAYLNKEALPEADAKIVREVIQKNDPQFDRDAAYEKRMVIIQEMQKAKQPSPLKELRKPKYKDVLNWLNAHEDVSIEIDPVKRAEGEAALRAFFEREDAANTINGFYAKAYAGFYDVYRRIMEEAKDGTASGIHLEVHSHAGLERILKKVEASQLSKTDGARIRAEYEALVKRYGLFEFEIEFTPTEEVEAKKWYAFNK